MRWRRSQKSIISSMVRLCPKELKRRLKETTKISCSHFYPNRTNFVIRKYSQETFGYWRFDFPFGFMFLIPKFAFSIIRYGNKELLSFADMIQEEKRVSYCHVLTQFSCLILTVPIYENRAFFRNYEDWTKDEMNDFFFWWLSRFLVLILYNRILNIQVFVPVLDTESNLLFNTYTYELLIFT